MKARYFFALVITGLSFLKTVPAQALPAYPIIDAESQMLSDQARWQWWNSLTPRQQYISQTIGQIVNNHYLSYGEGMPMTEYNFSYVVQTLGAVPGEYNFISSQIAANNNMIDVLDDMERELERTESLLNGLF